MFVRNWPGEPKIGDAYVVVAPKGVTDNCEVLAPDLRVRLEIMQRLLRTS
jgi:hypothetical protein